MNGRTMLYRDQYGETVVASTVKELRAKVGGGRVSRMYVDSIHGGPKHVGYVVGARWFSAFIPYEGKA